MQILGPRIDLWKYQQKFKEKPQKCLQVANQIFDMKFKELIKERLRGNLMTRSKWKSFQSHRQRRSRLRGLESQVTHLSPEVRHFPNSKDN